MKDRKTLLDAMANIDDAFIEEAAHPELILKTNRRAQRLRMLSSRRIGTLAACFVVAVGLVFAVPYLSKVSSVKDEAADDIELALSQALAQQQAELINSQKAAESSNRAVAEEAEANRAAEEANRAAEEANRAAEESKKAEMDKAAAEESKALAESVKSDKATYSDATTAVIELYTVDGVTYKFFAGTLYDAFIDAENVYVTDLVIPDTLGGVTVEKLHTEFWSSSETWETVTIPATVKKFGDISALPKSVTVICPEGSPAASFFKVMGYTVLETQQ